MSGVGTGKSLRVLVVEDNPDDSELLLRELKRGGYDLKHTRVETPTELRTALGRDVWDIVISDWSLPTFDGLTGFRIVREMGFDIPFIIVSGTIDEENAIEALKLGVNDFMAKGRFARLLPAIERELREAAVRQQKRITERDLERQRGETLKSERLLRSVLQTVPDGVIVVDDKGHIVLWSESAERVFGKQSSARPLSQWPEHYGLYRSDRSTPMSAADLPLVRALAGASVDRFEVYVRNEVITKGAWLSISARPLWSLPEAPIDTLRREHATTTTTTTTGMAEETIRGAVGVFRDVSKEKAAQEQLMISDRMASIGMLAAGVAHEINNPLGAALLNLELVHEMLGRSTTADQKQESSDIRESISDARSAVLRVREIVGDLKIFARHEEAAAVRADVREALETSLRMAFNEIRHRASVIKDYAPTPIVSGSQARLGQVFLNLIVNAAQAIPEGHVDENTIRITTRTNRAGRAVVEIADTGSGISAANIVNLFTPFFTTKPAGIGTGLGLPICHRIITQMLGTIEVESQVGKGTVFRVTLPPAPLSKGEGQTPRVTIRTTTPSSQRRGRILVVDDEPMLTSAIRRVLSSQHDVTTTTRAQDALERLRQGGSFDVIFSDLMMPQMTGMELYARICEEFPDHAPRVVFLTGGAFTQAARDFLATVSNPTLEKPIDRHGLLALVSERVKSPSIDPPQT